MREPMQVLAPPADNMTGGVPPEDFVLSTILLNMMIIGASGGTHVKWSAKQPGVRRGWSFVEIGTGARVWIHGAWLILARWGVFPAMPTDVDQCSKGAEVFRSAGG
jgi:hypothetical protein